MPDRAVYLLSKKFAPPKVDLRAARIADDWGELCHAQMLVQHRDPTDVSRRELEYYFDVWEFMEPQDLLFYAYAICLFAEDGAELPIFVERWLSVVDYRIGNLSISLSRSQAKVLAGILTELIADRDYEELANLGKFLRDHDGSGGAEHE